MKSFTIEIEDNKYEEFLGFCKLNSIEPEAFITKSFLEKYFLLKYGDLNEVVNEKPGKKKQVKKDTKESTSKKQPKEEQDIKVSEENTEKKPDEDKPKKKVRIIESH